ncbi:MAG: hypothetical protein DI534_09005 [Leifsonia xyli]|nr:MAG: hypothetical protein DI534_09005 [Leifsonia xyli]
MTASDLDARYGRTPMRRVRKRVAAIAAGTLLVIAVVAWLIWTAPLRPAASIESRDLDSTALSASSVEVRWQLTAPAGAEVSCAVKAVSAKQALTGWRIIEVPASDQTNRTLTATLRTSEPSIGGAVSRCWLSSQPSAADAVVHDLS